MSEPHWTDRVFRQKPEIFLAVHEAGLAYADSQAERLGQILQKFGVPAGGRLLDAPCGIGRHAVPLATRGWRVTGVDWVPEYVARATQMAREAEVADRAAFHQGDLRTLGEGADLGGPFQGILNIFTSIGYWEDETDRAIVRRFHDLTAPGGVLIVETINRDFVIKHFQATSVEEYGDLVNVDHRQLDLETSRVRSRWLWYRKAGPDLHLEGDESIVTRLYSPHELRALLEEAGWKTVQVYAGWDLKPPSSDAYRQMAIGRRAEG